MADQSFMQRMTAIPEMHNVFRVLLNPSNAIHGTQLIAVHGEHLPGGKKTDDYGIKFMLCFLASSGTVNWANEEVNQAALARYNAILDTPGFIQYKPAIISGVASSIPRHSPVVPTLDELYLALAFRVSIELEYIDTEHQVRAQTEYKIRNARTLREMLMVSDNETGFTDATKSKERNFSTTLPFSTSGFVEPEKIDELMRILRPPIDTSHKREIRDVVVSVDQMNRFIVSARKHNIVLPTKDCLEKRYSLTARYEDVNENEHESLHTDEDDGIVKDKGYEHKLCLIIPYDGGTEDAYETHITSFRNVKYKVENAMRGSVSSTISSTPPYSLPPSSLLVGYSMHIGRHLKTEFNGVATPDSGHSQASKEWNKCVIVPKDPSDKDIGFFQWKIINLGGVPHLVVNIWNLISRLEGTMGSGGIFISTTSETLQMCNLMGLQYVTGIDLTCVVPGMRTAGWVVLDKLSWEAEVRDVDSQIAHVHPIATGDRTRQHVSAKDIKRNIRKQLDDVNMILKIFNSADSDGNKISYIIDSTLKKATHKKNNVHDEMFTMYYFFKGITSGPEKEQFAAKPPSPVLTDISAHLTTIERILSSYHLVTDPDQKRMREDYRKELTDILTLVKTHEITIASFKLKPEAGEIDAYIRLVIEFIRQPTTLKKFDSGDDEDKLSEFTDIVEARLLVLGETTENIKKFIKRLLAELKEKKAHKKKGGKRNKTRKHRHQHLKRRITRIMRVSRRRSRGLRKRTNMCGRRQ